MGEKYEVICALLHPAGYRQAELHLHDEAALFRDCADYLLELEERSRELLDQQAALACWYALSRTQPAAIELRGEIDFFARLAAVVRQITAPAAQASPAAEQAVRQFMSEGLAAGEVVDVLAVADRDRPEISVLSDDFLDSITAKTEHRNVQVRLLEKLLKDEIRSRRTTSRAQAKLFSEKVDEILKRYELRQLTSAEVVKKLVELAKSLRDGRRRHEELGLTVEEAAFYAVLAGADESKPVDPQLAAIAADLTKGIRADLTVDWADRESVEAAIRRKIKRLLRRHNYRPPLPAGGGGGGDGDSLNYYTAILLDQAKALWRYWPDTEEGRLFQ